MSACSGAARGSKRGGGGANAETEEEVGDTGTGVATDVAAGDLYGACSKCSSPQELEPSNDSIEKLERCVCNWTEAPRAERPDVPSGEAGFEDACGTRSGGCVGDESRVEFGKRAGGRVGLLSPSP